MTPRIDAHLHVFAKVSSEFPRETNDQFPADREEPVEKLLKEMEENSVDQAVLVQLGGTSLDHHAYLRYCLKTYSDRFLGIGLIPEEDQSPEEHMDRLAEEEGLVGFRLSSIGGPINPLEPLNIQMFKSYPIWKRAAEKDYVLWLYPREEDVHTVPYLISEFPQVRVVFNHLLVCPGKRSFCWDKKGRPQVALSQLPPRTHYSTLRLHQHENVHVHLSGQYAFSKEDWPYLDLSEWHKQLYGGQTGNYGFGANRLMWGTDFPWILEDPGYLKMTQIVKKLLPDLLDGDLEEIMGGTAKRILRFPEIKV